MGFKDHKVKSEYRSLIDNVVQDFYIPLLRESVSYKRAVGFFSSSSLVEISKGIAEMASEGGKIQIVASPYLSDEDIEAIKKGYDDRNQIIEKALLAQIAEEPTDYYSMERLNLLASLIADGVMDIQIAYRVNILAVRHSFRTVRCIVRNISLYIQRTELMRQSVAMVPSGSVREGSS